MIALQDLLTASSSMRSGDTPVCCDETGVIDFATFRERVRQRARYLRRRDAVRYLLCTDDVYAFACGLFALLAAQKTVVIPANATAGHIASLSLAYDDVWDGSLPLPLSVATTVARDDDDYAATDAVPTAHELIIDAEALLTLYTSGSSGAPKPVHKTLAQLDAEVRTLEATWGTLLGDRTVVGGVPHHHIYGLLFRVLWPLAAGRVFERNLCIEPSQLQTSAHRNGPIAFISAPAQLSRWPQAWDLTTALPAQTVIFSAGGPLLDDTAGIYADALGQAPLDVFGSTETGAIAWRRQGDSPRWRALSGVDVRVGENSALEIRSPHLGHTQWHRTDDAAVIDDDGHFALVGRLDRVVKMAGKRLSLPELEAQLLTHPSIAAVATVAFEMAGLGGVAKARVGAIVVLRESGFAYLRIHGRQALTRMLRRHLAAVFDVVVLPRHWRFRFALPYDDRGKLTAGTLRALFFPDPNSPVTLAEWRDEGGWHYAMHLPPTLAVFNGHFPGLPLLPGVVQVHWATKLAIRDVIAPCDGGHGGYRGHGNPGSRRSDDPAAPIIDAIDRLKFKAPVRPGATLLLTLRHDAPRHRVAFSYRIETRTQTGTATQMRGVTATQAAAETAAETGTETATETAAETATEIGGHMRECASGVIVYRGA